VRAVIDTNVMLSGLMWHGAPRELMKQIRNGALALVSSPVLLAELTAVLSRAKFDAILARSQTSRERILSEVRQLADIIEAPPFPKPVCRDPDDDEVLALAVAARADLIISGDDDLLSLGRFDGIPILNPVDALRAVSGGS